MPSSRATALTSSSSRGVERGALPARWRCRLATDLAFGAAEQPRHVLAMAGKQQEREDGEEQRRLRPAADPERDRRRRACDQSGERGIAGERGGREPDQAEQQPHRPSEPEQHANIGGNALAALELEPDRKEMPDEGAEAGGKRETGIIGAYERQ